MDEQLTGTVIPVFSYGLALHDRLRAGEEPDFHAEQANFQNLLACRDEVRYPLICWLDEIFIFDSPWSVDWENNSLEVFYTKEGLRAEKFWKEEEKTVAGGALGLVEVYYLCVMLGFRGNRRNGPPPPEGLTRWRRNTERLIKPPHQPTGIPPDQNPEPDERWLDGQDKFQFALLVVWLTSAFLLGLVAFLILSGFGQS